MQDPSEKSTKTGETKQKNGSSTDLLKKLYYGLGEESGYSSAERLHKAIKKQGVNLNIKDVKKWLQQQHTYTTHKKVKYTFPRRKVKTLRIDEYWSADLIQMNENLSRLNNSYDFICTVIDNFSRKAFARKMKNKTKAETEAALRSIIEER